MIPILFEKGTTAFVNNGLGRLRDCTECVVTEERNGIYECDFSVPINGVHFDLIQCGRIIYITHDETGDMQPFDIVSYSKPIDGIVTFHAVHISYRLTALTAYGSNINSLSAALSLLKNDAKPANPFSFWTDKSGSEYFAAADGFPHSVRQMIGGMEGSILDSYGGELEFDEWTVKLWNERGTVRNFAIRYGVNMTEYQDDLDYENTYTSVIPYWKGQDSDGNETIVIGSMQTVGESFTGGERCVPLDVTDKFNSEDGVPTQAQVEAEGLTYLQTNRTYLPAQTISVNFVRLSDSPEYEQLKSLQTCKLCDSVNVIFPDYGTRELFKIVKTEYDVLNDKYLKLELGQLSVSLSQAMGVDSPSTTTLNTYPTPPTVPTLEDISSGFTFGGAWTSIVKKAYKYDKMVFFHLEASTSSYTANYSYTIATIASSYRPNMMFIGNGYTTDGSYNPKAVVSVRINSNGNIIVDAQNNTGAYFFITGFYVIP